MHCYKPMLPRIAKFGRSPLQFFSLHNLIPERKETSLIIVNSTESSFTNVKRAKLSARKKERIKFPNFDYNGGDVGDAKNLYCFSNFLKHPSGIEAMLNTSALQSIQLLGSNIYRCTLPEVKLLNVEVTPILDLRVSPTDEDCTVELLSCKFEGSNVVERQNDYFSGGPVSLVKGERIFLCVHYTAALRASMTNHITWGRDSNPCLNIDVKLNLALEVYTKPFTLLPISAVERPGNLMMQALLDRLVPLLMRQLLQDYGKWVKQQTQSSATSVIYSDIHAV